MRHNPDRKTIKIVLENGNILYTTQMIDYKQEMVEEIKDFLKTDFNIEQLVDLYNKAYDDNAKASNCSQCTYIKYKKQLENYARMGERILKNFNKWIEPTEEPTEQLVEPAEQIPNDSEENKTSETLETPSAEPVKVKKTRKTKNEANKDK